MKKQWTAALARFDALALRERRLIAVAALGGVLLVGWALFIDPALARWKMAERGAVEQRAQLAALQAQIVALQSPNQDPDAQARTELAALKLQLSRLNERLAAMQGSLVSPQRIPALLEELIGRRSGLRLLGLKTLPVKPLLEKSAAAAGAPPTQLVTADPSNAAGEIKLSGNHSEIVKSLAEVKSMAEKSDAAAGVPTTQPVMTGLYKHGVEIRLEGSYSELADYLARLEKSAQKLLWTSVVLSADNHPRLVLTLTVYTLSLDKTWLMV